MEMSYREKYNELIEFRKNNPPEEGAYIEHHHIIPKSIAPELINDKDNIVSLTGAEHMKAHYYLAQALKEEGDKKKYRKMAFAFTLMKKNILKNSVLNENELDTISKMYNDIRKDLSKSNKGENNPMYGKHFTDEQKRKISEGTKNPSEETRKKMSIAKKKI